MSIDKWSSDLFPTEKRKNGLKKHAGEIAQRDGGWHCHYCQQSLLPDAAPHCHPYYHYIGKNPLIKWLHTRFPEIIQWHVPEFMHEDEILGVTWRIGDGFQYYVIDHKIPVSRGGTNRVDNLVLACWACNSHKGKLTPEEFAAKTAKEGMWWIHRRQL